LHIQRPYFYPFASFFAWMSGTRDQRRRASPAGRGAVPGRTGSPTSQPERAWTPPPRGLLGRGQV
jgi:hypothetical protein